MWSVYTLDDRLLLSLSTPHGMFTGWWYLYGWMTMESWRCNVGIRWDVFLHIQRARCCERVRAYITKLYNQSGSVTGLFPGFQTSASVTWTEQTPHENACGLHVLSHIYLASKGLQHTHTFDNGFVEDLRTYCLKLLYQYRCGRRTTLMTPLDLTLDNPRSRLLSSY